MNEDNNIDMLDMALGVVNTYIQYNHVPMEALAQLIRTTYEAVNGLTAPAAPEAAPAPEPAVNPKKSITPDYLISLVDGKRYKSLKRHLSNKGYTPASYREAFGLAADYPMVAPNYAAQRSALAKAAGLGRKPGQVSGTVTPVDPVPDAA